MARRHDLDFFETDDFFWEATDPPYQRPNDRALRQTLLLDALRKSNGWVLAGSLCGWGDDVIPLLDLAIYVTTATPLRLRRLREREHRLFGDRIAPGGDMHEQHNDFLEWAAQYDNGSLDVRSRRLHGRWMLALPCRVCRVDAQGRSANCVTSWRTIRPHDRTLQRPARADALDQVLSGRVVLSLEARTREARKWLEHNEQQLSGRRVERVVSHGKHLIGYISADYFFHSHLMMWGR